MTRPDWDEYFLSIAKVVATRASCPRKSVGAVLVRNNRILSTGYNGAPKGMPHCTDVGCNIVDNHCERARHAEMNALHYVVNHEQIPGSIMYCTLQPCDHCRGVLTKYGVEDFKWIEDYPSLM